MACSRILKIGLLLVYDYDILAVALLYKIAWCYISGQHNKTKTGGDMQFASQFHDAVEFPFPTQIVNPPNCLHGRTVERVFFLVFV